MDRGSGTLSKQMADFVIVCTVRQYTHSQRKNNEPLYQSKVRYGCNSSGNAFCLSICLFDRPSACLPVCLMSL